MILETGLPALSLQACAYLILPAILQMLNNFFKEMACVKENSWKSLRNIMSTGRSWG
jgi:hypothetical protein